VVSSNDVSVAPDSLGLSKRITLVVVAPFASVTAKIHVRPAGVAARIWAALNGTGAVAFVAPPQPAINPATMAAQQMTGEVAGTRPGRRTDGRLFTMGHLSRLRGIENLDSN